MVKRFGLVFTFIVTMVMLSSCSWGIFSNELRLITTSQIENFTISDGKEALRYTGENTIASFYNHVKSIYVRKDRLTEQEDGTKYFGEMVLKIEVDATRDREFKFDIVKTGTDAQKTYYIQKIYNEKYYLSEQLSQDLVDYFYNLYYGNTIIID